jgi:Heat shock factor binding protein 1
MNEALQVETLLEQLDAKFDDMSSQIIERSALSFPLRPVVQRFIHGVWFHKCLQ